jgi:vitamin B12 transporter
MCSPPGCEGEAAWLVSKLIPGTPEASPGFFLRQRLLPAVTQRPGDHRRAYGRSHGDGDLRTLRVTTGNSAAFAGTVAVAVSLALCRAARAAELSVEPVVVTAPRVTEPEALAPTSFATVIDAAQHAEQVETVADALAESVGVTVRRFGGLGAFSTVSIRGSSANQVQVYLDGIPLSRARNETVNLGDLPLDSLERIEVYRGTVPVAFGTGAIGGVVNLVTKPPSVAPSTEASAAYGSFATRKVLVSHSEQLHGVDLLAYVTYLGSNGDFPFLNDRGTPLNRSDDFVDIRHNNSFNSVDALLKAGYTVAPGLRVDLTSDTFYKDQGVPGIGQHQSDTASLGDLRTVNYLRLRSSQWLDDALDVTATLFGQYERANFSDPNHDLGTGAQDRNDQTSVVGGNVLGTYYATAHHALSWFSELTDERFSPYNALAQPPKQPDQTRLQSSLALQDVAAYLDGRVQLVPTVRYQHLDDSTSATFTPANEPSGASQSHHRNLWSPSIGSQVLPFPWFTLRGNIGYFERAPNFSELFGNGGSVIGNGNLHPEWGMNRDVGFISTWAAPPLDALRVEYAYFNNDINDVIIFRDNGTRATKAFNAGGARIRGDEVSVDATGFHHVRLDVNYTYQDAQNRSTANTGHYVGNQLPGRPANELYTRLEVFNRRGKLFYEFNYVSGNYLDELNFLSVPSRDVHSLGWSLQVLPQVTLSFEARNITDNQVSDVGGFPLPGRSYFGSVRFNY